MKKLVIVLIAVMVLDFGARLWNPAPASAQAATVPVLFAPQVVNALSQCTIPTGATLTNGVVFCFVDTGSVSTSALYFSINGSTTFTLVNPAAAGGVATFNGRTGNVTLTKADVLATSPVVATTVTSTATSTVQ